MKYKLILVGLLLAVVLISGCTQQTETSGETGAGETVADEDVTAAVPADGETDVDEMVVADEPANGEDEGTTETEEETVPETEETQGELKEFAITAKQWNFTPSTIEVNEGDTVKLTITSIDVTHGFSLPEFGVDGRLEPNQTTTVEFIADKVGTFTFACNVLCGAGHSTMNGTLIVN